MDEQLRPTQGPHAHEIDLLTEVADIVRQAIAEYRADCTIAGRLEVAKASRLLDRTFHGEAC